MEQIYRYVYVLAFLTIASAALCAQDTDAQKQGQKIFIEKRCCTSHTIKAQSAEIEAAKAALAGSKGFELKEDKDKNKGAKGGDFSDVGNERDQKWLSDLVRNPKKYFKSESILTANPNVKSRLRKSTGKGLRVRTRSTKCWLLIPQHSNTEVCRKRALSPA